MNVIGMHLQTALTKAKHFRSNSLITSKNVRPIAPAVAPSTTDANQQAQLLLRWPGGETMQLSNLPFLQNSGKNSSPAKRDGQEQVKKSPKKVRLTFSDANLRSYSIFWSKL